MSDTNRRVLEGVEGQVKWFDPKKGFGFIIGPDGQDIMAHYTVIDGAGFRVLQDGATVTYDAELSDKGWRATKVIRHEPLEVQVRSTRKYARTPRR